MSLLIKSLATVFEANIVLIEGISDNIPLIQAHIKERLQTGQSVKVLKQKITKAWLQKLVEAFIRNFDGDHPLSPQQTVIEQLEDIRKVLVSSNENTDAALIAMKELASAALKEEIAFIA